MRASGEGTKSSSHIWKSHRAIPRPAGGSRFRAAAMSRNIVCANRDEETSPGTAASALANPSTGIPPPRETSMSSGPGTSPAAMTPSAHATTSTGPAYPASSPARRDSACSFRSDNRITSKRPSLLIGWCVVSTPRATNIPTSPSKTQCFCKVAQHRRQNSFTEVGCAVAP